jgi:excinuclease UvrABC nuclease subunit
MSGDNAWLETHNFCRVGSWSLPAWKMQRERPLDRTLGIYALVFARKVQYIGKAEFLRSRLRGYNRSFKEPNQRAFRTVHSELPHVWKEGGTINVWLHDLVTEEGPLLVLENRWIKELNPPLNGTGSQTQPKDACP